MPAVFDREFVKRLDGANVKKGANKMDLAELSRERFATEHQIFSRQRAFVIVIGQERLNVRRRDLQHVNRMA